MGVTRCPTCGIAGLDKDAPRLWNPTELADFLGVEENLLANWRYRRIGPKFIKIGGLVRYSADAIHLFIEENTQECTRGSEREQRTVFGHVQEATTRLVEGDTSA